MLFRSDNMSLIDIYFNYFHNTYKNFIYLANIHQNIILAVNYYCNNQINNEVYTYLSCMISYMYTNANYSNDIKIKTIKAFIRLIKNQQNPNNNLFFDIHKNHIIKQLQIINDAKN